MQWICLWLEGPMQSWGSDSKFGRRESLAFPTRSGILGLLCSALGKTGNQEVWLKKMQTYEQEIISYSRVKINGEKIGREILLRDFHMVGSGYNSKDPWESMLTPKKSDGTTPVGSGAKITNRAYLQDAVFACLLAVPDDEAQEISQALQVPTWTLSLGRKNCVPTEFIFQGLYLSKEEAHKKAILLAQEKNKIEDFRIVEGTHENGELININDVPLSFGLHKNYKDRQVTWIPSQ